MAPLLLVVGALMSGAGLYAVIYGYSIIQLEQGWASVISGATLVAGGVVTIALGLVLRVLKQVRTGLLDMPGRVQPEPIVSAPGATTAEAGPDALAAPPPQLENPTSTFAPRAGQAEPSFSLPAAKDIAPAAPAAVPETVYEPAASTPPAPIDPTEPARTADAAEPGPPSTAEPPQILPPQPEPFFGAPRPADDYKLETPSTAEHDLPPADLREPTKAFGEPVSPAMDDWLDRAFAELDRDNPPVPPRKSQIEAGKPIPAVATSKLSGRTSSHLTSAGESAAATLEPEVTESAPAPFPPAEPASSSPQQTSATAPSAVIGRYESDGMTYVMFADGSIEAQSASGVYRFASMAELKAYIEN